MSADYTFLQLTSSVCLYEMKKKAIKGSPVRVFMIRNDFIMF